jgi:hypothetical protein
MYKCRDKEVAFSTPPLGDHNTIPLLIFLVDPGRASPIFAVFYVKEEPVSGRWS